MVSRMVGRMIGGCMQDLRYALRQLRKSPGFTVTAVLVLAIGIGMNVAAFSLFNAAALKMLPVRDPASLVRLQRRSPDATTNVVPYTSMVFYRDHARTLQAVMGTMGGRIVMDNDVQPIGTDFVTENYFAELGETAAFGRLLQPADGAPDAAPVAVLSYGFWQSRFESDPSAVGKTIRLNKKMATVVGVAPYAFASLGDNHPNVWLPISQVPYFIEGSKALVDTSFSAGVVEMWGRLAPAVTAPMAEQELLGLTNELRKQYPKEVWDKEYIRSDPGGHLQVMDKDMYLVFAMIGTLALLILAVACANLGGLMLARGVTREHEIGIRIAIGANKLRIFRQLFTESLLLAVLGSAAGLALGYVVLRVGLVTTNAPAWMSAAPDWRVLLFALGMALATSIFFGLAPALHIARQQHRKTVARQVLVGAQVAASCVLIILAGLLVRAARHALHTDPGFGYEQVLSIDPGLGSRGDTPAAAQAFLDQFVSRLRSLPGVTSVALSSMPPLQHERISVITNTIGGHKVPIYPFQVTPEFFRTMGIPLLRGRNLLPGEKNAVIVSESLARVQWPGEDPLGKRDASGSAAGDMVVGVAGNARLVALNDSDAVELYHAAQPENMQSMVVLVKTAGAPDGLVPMVQTIGESIRPNLFLLVRLLKGEFREGTKSAANMALVVSLLGMVAVLLAVVGIVGLVAHTVSQRTKEIAIRLALGSERARVLVAVLRQFLWPVAVGLLAGAGIAAAVSKALRNELYGVSNLDPLSYAGAVMLLTAIIAMAALLPARRALGIDLPRILRYQ